MRVGGPQVRKPRDENGSLLYLLVNPRMIDSLPPTELWVSDGTAQARARWPKCRLRLRTPITRLSLHHPGGRAPLLRPPGAGSGVELWTLEALAAPKAFVYLPQVTH